MRAEAAPVGAGWYLRLPDGQTVSLAPAYRPVSRRFRPAPSTLLRPEHGLVPFLARQVVLDQISGWCQGPPGTRVLLVTGGGGSGKTRLGREAYVQMLVAGWDAGIADDRRRDGTATTRLQRPTLLAVDDADRRTGLISALVDYLRWDDAGPPVGLLLLARAAGAWWDRLVRQQGLEDAYTVVDLDRHPIPPADRAEHFRRASIAFAAYGGPGARPTVPPPAAELADPAYAEPLLIHIAALLRTADMSATPAPGAGEGRASGKDFAAGQGLSARQGLLRALCERERTRWHELGAGSHLAFNPDLPLADQVVALATLTATADPASATSLLAALPNQAEVTRIGAEALAAWAHRLYAGPGYWNPLRPDLLAEQHLADTPQLPALAIAAARLTAGQDWEARVLTQLLAELTRGAPNQPAVQAALDELLAAALLRIVDLAITTGPAELADLASLALQLAPQLDLAAPLADRMPEHSVRLAALAATSCGTGRLRPWGRARERVIRLLDGKTARLRPQRARCRSCRRTHVLLPLWCAPRRADGIEVIGSGRIGQDLGVPAATVRGWLRLLRSHTEEMRQDAMHQLGVIGGTDPVLPEPSGSPLGDAQRCRRGRARGHHPARLRAGRPVAAAGPVRPGPPPRARPRRLIICRQPGHPHACGPAATLITTTTATSAPRTATP